MRTAGYVKGVGMVVLAAVLWSTMGVAIRSLDQMGTWQVLFWRSLGMIPVLTAFIWWRSRDTKTNISPPRMMDQTRPVDQSRLANQNRLAGLIGALGLVAAFAGAIFAIQTLPLANAVFLFSAAPFLTALLGRFILGENVRLATLAAIGIAGLGIWRMIGAGSVTDGAMAGSLSAIGSAMGFSVFTVALRFGKGGEMLSTVILGAIFSMAAAVAVLASQGQPVAGSVRDTVIAIGAGAVILGLGMTLFTLGSRVVPAGELAVLSLIEVMLAPVWGWLLLSEVPESRILQGGGLILIAVIFNAATGATARSVRVA